jgi:hypothetical protein
VCQPLASLQSGRCALATRLLHENVTHLLLHHTAGIEGLQKLLTLCMLACWGSAEEQSSMARRVDVLTWPV